MHSKRGQEMSTSTIILIVLGLIVLVILAIGFMMGWENVAPWLASKSNVEDVRRQCSLACSKESKYDYCSKLVELKDEKKNKIEGATCNLLSGIPTFKTKWGIETCSKIDCDKFECEIREPAMKTSVQENILKNLVVNSLTISGDAQAKPSITNTNEYYDLTAFASADSFDDTNKVCEINALNKKDEKSKATLIVLK